jgi:predicted RNA polymerase sigma factor
VIAHDHRPGAHRAAEVAARASYGKLLAYLAVRSRDVPSAEDALGEAFVAALETWPRRGVPDNPEAWLLVAARRRLVDRTRHAAVEVAAEASLRLALERAREDAAVTTVFPDDRLKLLFVCAHPAIDEALHTPLMLQTVLGLDAATISSAFLVAPSTMGQRLSRVKAKIRDAGIRFDVPDIHELPARLDAVLNAIYAAYGTGWDDVVGADRRRKGIADEAIWLGRLVAGLLPQEPEARALLALMLYCESRRAARRGADGRYVPLAQQDVARWSRSMIDDAERLLADASSARAPGRFQLEAAIQSVHAQRARGATTDWRAIALLYEGLLRIAPTIGARVAHAAALAEAESVEAGLAALGTIPADVVATYQPYWAMRAHLHRRAGLVGEAREAYARAIGLSEDAAVREFLAASARGRSGSAR